jgi:hypothetical protein
MKMDYRKHYTRHFENLLTFVGILDRKAYVQSLEWAVAKSLRFNMNVPCIVDYLEYFDWRFGLR